MIVYQFRCEAMLKRLYLHNMLQITVEFNPWDSLQIIKKVEKKNSTTQDMKNRDGEKVAIEQRVPWQCYRIINNKDTTIRPGKRNYEVRTLISMDKLIIMVNS